jgi:hypothetical protein
MSHHLINQKLLDRDVKEIKDWNKSGGVRHIALCYGRVTAQVGKTKCAELVGCSVTTVSRYTKTLDLLADYGYIVHVKDLAPDTEYDWDAIGVTQEVWDETYETARWTRKDGTKVSKALDRGGVIGQTEIDQTLAKTPELLHEAIKTSPRLAKVAEEAVWEAKSERAQAVIREYAEKHGAAPVKPDVDADYVDADYNVGGGVLGEALTQLDVVIQDMGRSEWLLALARVSAALERNIRKGVEKFDFTTDPAEIALVQKIQNQLTGAAFLFSDGFLPAESQVQ